MIKAQYQHHQQQQPPPGRNRTIRIGVVCLMVYYVTLEALTADYSFHHRGLQDDTAAGTQQDGTKPVLYVHIPKMGGPTMEEALAQQNYSNAFSSVLELQSSYDHNVYDYLVATTCRDPCERFAAVYNDQATMASTPTAPALKEFYNENKSFEDYVLYLENTQQWAKIQRLVSFRPAYAVMIDPASDEFGIDVVMFYEQFDDKVDQLIDEYIDETDNTKNNTSIRYNNSSSTSSCSPETREILELRYAMDYCLFGYAIEKYPAPQPGQCIGSYMNKANLTERYQYCQEITAADLEIALEQHKKQQEKEEEKHVIVMLQEEGILNESITDVVIVGDETANTTIDMSKETTNVIFLDDNNNTIALDEQRDLKNSHQDTNNATISSNASNVIFVNGTSGTLKLSAHQLWSISHYKPTKNNNWTDVDGNTLKVSEESIRYSKSNEESSSAAETEEKKKDNNDGENIVINWEEDPLLEKVVRHEPVYSAKEYEDEEDVANFDESLINWNEDENFRSVQEQAVTGRTKITDRVVKANRPSSRRNKLPKTPKPTRAPNFISNTRRENEKRDQLFEDARNSPEYISRLNANSTVAN